jgi:ABC-type branched-subunit amino acid transport system substrate-binding protein
VHGRSARYWLIGLVAAVVIAAGCTTSDSDSPSSSGADATAPEARTASARGVTADTIKVGFSYIDLESLAEAGVIKISHGPYEEIIKSLVDDVNARGGIQGRTLELVTAKYSPIGNTEQLAACTQLTEDEQVFVVLNGLLYDNNLCVVQQHSTALISSYGLNGTRLGKARAPWATYGASDERAIEALVRILDESGELEGHTIAVYAAQAANKPLIDQMVKAVEDAGYTVADTALMDAPDTDVQAATAQDKIIAQRFMDEGVDTVLNVGLFIPGADFDAAGFHPRMYSLDIGNIAAAAFTNPLGKFPIVAGLGATGDPDAAYNTAEFNRCRDVYKKATGKEIKTTTQEDLEGESSGYTAMAVACTTMQIFTAAAEAAGANLTNDSFQKGLESVGKIELANTPTASFGPGKPDGQDSFQLLKFDPTWKEGEGKQQNVPVGKPITLGP